MGQAALAFAAWEIHFDRLDNTRRGVRAHQKRLIQPSHPHVLEECGHRLSASYLDPAMKCRNTRWALNRKTPGRQYRLAFGAGT
jgi:hypothetical protein